MPLDTLPSLKTVSAVACRRYAVRMTIVFHPDLSRIGAHADLATWSGDELRPRLDLILGRSTLAFSDGLTLQDPRVSRQALRIRSERDGVEMVGLSDSMRCRIGRDELDHLWLSGDALTRGVPVRLGHGVVLMARQVELPLSAPAVSDDTYPGCSVETQIVRQLIAAAAASNLPVLILGDSGVGKEMIARGIHHHSPRRARSLVCVNVAAIPETLAAAELFGTEKGAFTGAQARSGHFRDAHRGTLFLDEIGDTPAQVQAQLLRVIQEQEVQVVGGGPVPVDVRIVAATDAPVDTASGFRNALRQRLAGLTIEVPPLRLRPEDIGPQVLRMLTVAGIEHPSAPISRVLEDPEIAARWARIFFNFILEEWSGNSRELQHAVTRALMSDDGAWVYEIPGEDSSAAGAISDIELEAVYEDCGFEPAATATALGLSRGALYRRLKAHPTCRIATEVSDTELDDAIARVGCDPRALSQWLRVSACGLAPRLAQRQ